jgi:hypothetical protein
VAQRNCYTFLAKTTIPVPSGAHGEVPELRGQEELLYVLPTINISAPAGAHREVPKLQGAD